MFVLLPLIFVQKEKRIQRIKNKQVLEIHQNTACSDNTLTCGESADCERSLPVHVREEEEEKEVAIHLYEEEKGKRGEKI